MKKILFALLLVLPFLTFAQDTLVKWTFPAGTSDSIADGGITVNQTMTLCTKGGTGVFTYPAGSLTPSLCASADKWNAGNGTKYWQIKVVSLGYNNLKLSSKQKSSGTGPKDFKAQYMVGYAGTWTDISGGTVLVGNNWTGVLTNVPLPSECNNKDTVYVRWIMTSDISVGGAAVASGGTSRIDEIVVKGTLIDLIPPTVSNAFATSLSNVKVKFNEAVADTTAENVSYYTGLGVISSAVLNATLDTVNLTLTTPLTSGVPATLYIAHVKDTSGNVMAAPQNFQVTYTVTPTDILPPTVLTAYATSLTNVKVKFSETVADTTAENVSYYTGLGVISSAVLNTLLDTVSLTLATPLTSGVAATLTIAHVKDTSGNVMAAPQNFQVTYTTPFVDIIPPTVFTAYAKSLSNIKVVFSEAVADTTAENVSYYTGLGVISSADLNITLDTVSLTLSTPLVFGVADTLYISNIKDTSGNVMNTTPQFRIQYGNLNNQNIVISEIMFNPPESGTDSLEFIELYNNSNNEVELKNFYFSAGVTYTFHNDTIFPHSFYTVAVDSIKFKNFYSQTAHKWTSGGLSNSGEPIALKDNYGILIDSVDYKTSSPWSTAANGNGSSLMLCDYSLDNNLGANWVASDATNASTFAIVNTKQVYATPDSGCIVFTDLIPPTVLNAYATGLSKVKVKFSEAVDNTAENVVNYTGIGTISTAVRSASNDTVTLTLTTPLQSGVPATLTISDVKDIAGNPMATSQNFEITYTIPEIVITEIMYDDPSASSDSLEFIELYNNGSAQANISNFSFSSGIVYTFPANTTIAANDYLVIAKNISAVNTFFGISGTLQWTSGSLSNSGEKIEIINIGGDVIDSLTYKTSAPWPTAAAGNGPSLTLCNPSLDNSIGSNWQASEEFVDSLNHIAVSATPGTGCVTTNIENHLAKNYSVNCYPNPASKGLTVSLEGQAKEIFVYDLIGNIVYKTNNVTSITTINTEKLNEGIYFIKIIFNDNTTITKKISII